jgi:hypothetical protein
MLITARSLSVTLSSCRSIRFRSYFIILSLKIVLKFFLFKLQHVTASYATTDALRISFRKIERSPKKSFFPIFRISVPFFMMSTEPSLMMKNVSPSSPSFTIYSPGRYCYTSILPDIADSRDCARLRRSGTLLRTLRTLFPSDTLFNYPPIQASNSVRLIEPTATSSSARMSFSMT